MKKSILISLIILFLCISTVQADTLPEPAADFTGDPNSGEAPLAVQFTDSSTGNLTSWSWDFGDGNTSAEQSPAHTYVTAGTYTVSLTVTNTEGSDTKIEADYIIVSEPEAPPEEDVTETPTPTPTATPTPTPAVAYNITYTFKDSSNNNLVSGVRIRITGDDSYSSVKTTNTDGVSSFSLYDGQYSVYISAFTFKDVEEQLAVNGADKEDTIYLERGNNVKLLILDADTDDPLYAARVFVNTVELGITGTDGIVSDNLRKGASDEYRISVTRTGYTTNSTIQTIAIDETEIIILMEEGEAAQTETPTPTPTPIPIQTYGVVDQVEMDRLAAEQEEIQAQIAALEKEIEEEKNILNMILGFFKGLFGMG